VSASSRRIDRLEPIFDHDQIVANAGLVLPATLMARLGLETLINEWVGTGSFRPGRKIFVVRQLEGTSLGGLRQLVGTRLAPAARDHL